MINLLRRKNAGIITLIFVVAAALAVGLFSVSWAKAPEDTQPSMQDVVDDNIVIDNELARVPLGAEPEKDSQVPAQEPSTADVSEETEPVSAPVFSADSSYVYVKVGLNYGSSAVSKLEISCPDGFFIAKVSGRTWTYERVIEGYTSLNAYVSGGNVVIGDVQGNVVIPVLASDEVIMAASESSDSRVIKLGGASYRDGVMLLPYSGRLTVINFIETEHYLQGVINNEMTYNNPNEALKAQAVAARSFLVSHYNYHSKYGFDVCATGNCQVYGGVKSEHTETTRACNETKGLIMVYDGKAAGGYYFASSGGFTFNSEDVWGSKIGYLRGVKDDYASLSVWDTSMGFEEIQSRLEKNGHIIGALQSVSISSRFDNGGVKTMLFTGDSGSVTIKGADLPSFFGTSTVKSNMFSMGSEACPGVEIIQDSRVEAVMTTGGEVSADMIYVINASGSIDIADISGAYVTSGRVLTPLVRKNISISSKTPVFTDSAVEGGTLYFSGVGNGHGVGMPQLSAIAMAKNGSTFDEILNYYYTDIELRQVSALQ